MEQETVSLMELNDLYSEKILDLAANAPNPGRLAAPDGTARKVAKVCGSLIEVDLSIQNGVITGYGHKVSACALGQTSASVVAREIVGTTVAEFSVLRDTMLAMLTVEGPVPAGKWADLAYLEPVRAFPHRHASTMLVFEAVLAAVENAESKQAHGAQS
ncbi:iron-sulfur cluster assembly scaffold protein [Devosia sp. WQ 349K1]|uniref:iron-sulfur cluster assembly scaffold protein n=1 Tax=Devosia sp. WQ 349K1 TaxID=2800329 RepID=UPI00349F4926